MIDTNAARSLFDMPSDVTYLNCASMAPQMRAVTTAGEAALRERTMPWNLASAAWFAGGERLRTLFARLVHASSDDVAIVPGASYGVAVAAANVPVARGQSIVVLDGEFPSGVLAWRDVATRRGARLVTVQKRRADDAWTDAVLDAIDDDTAVVAVPNCHWTDGTLVDLVRVGERAREVGAALVVDASQSLGAHPLDVRAVRPDFLVTVGYKWLLGPYGLGYLYVDPKWHARGVPIEHTWLTRAGAEDFARLADDADAYRAGARRFDMGEFPQFVSASMAAAALEQVVAWGVDEIARALAPLTARVAAGVASLGGAVPASERRVAHIAGVRLADTRLADTRVGGAMPRGLADALARERVYASLRGDVLRVAPHLYNDAADVDRLVAVLRSALE